MIKENDVLILDVTETNILGNGVAKYGDLVVFCLGAVAGDCVSAKITEVKKNCAVARIESILEASPNRITPECPHYYKCGGCSFSHITYEHETEIKRAGIEASFRRCACCSEKLESFTADVCKEYRNKAVFHFDSDKNLGYFSHGTRDFVKVDKCIICDPVINKIKNEAEILLKEEKNISSSDLTYLYIRYMKETEEASVAVGYTGKSSLKGFAEKLSSLFPEIKGVVRGKAPSPESRDERFETVIGEKDISGFFCGLKLTVSPEAFFQVNHDNAEKLCMKVCEYAALKEGEIASDLYCGTGIIGLTLAKNSPQASVCGIEINEKSVENAKRNAAANGIDNIGFFACDSSDFIKGTEPGSINCAVVDPPRTGLSDKTVKELKKLNPERIVYVSCNPSTLARDVKALSEKYTLKKVSGVDMFPRTSHVETVVLMSRS